MTADREPPARFSVIVVSRGRPEMLLRCLKALDQVIWPMVEVIVVADSAGRGRLRDLTDIKLIPFDEPNIAAARNLGLAAAGGDLVAFIDDDAVAEPMWLAALAGVFADAGVGAATGPVLGRNGISLQSGAETVLGDGRTEPARGEPALRRARAGRAPKTVGTNMAFRAEVLRDAGGFDETFRFYLDEADLNMRLGRAGVVTAYAPLAVVHHATAPSSRRRADRTPLDLSDIGRSTGAFLLRHCPAEDRARALASARAEQWTRAVGGLVSGRLEPRDLRRLMAGYDAGVREGLSENAPRLARPGPRTAFHPRPWRPARHVVIAGALGSRETARVAAGRAAAEGATVSLFLFSYTALYHRVSYADGVWTQRGGIWGRSERIGPLLHWATRRTRLDAEVARVAGTRGLKRFEVPSLAPESVTSVEWAPFF